MNLSKVLTIFINLYPLWIILSSLVGFMYPPSFQWFSGQYMVFALAFVMLGMGLTLNINDFKEILKMPGAVALGAFSQFTIMPLVGWGLAKVMNLDVPLAVGLILVACCPGGTASNVISYLAKANVALSVIMTTVSTFLAIMVTPLLTGVFAGTYVQVDGWGIFFTTIKVVLIPVIMGVYCNHKFPKSIEKMGKTGPLVAVIAIVFIAGGIVAQSADIVAKYALQLFLAATLLHGFGFLFSYILSRLLKYNHYIAKTISIETGMQNGGLAAVLAKENFSTNPLIAVPSVFTSVVQTLMGGLLAAYWSWKWSKTEKQKI